MPPDDKNKLNSLEELKNKLFTKDYEVKTDRLNTAFSPAPKKSVPDAWDNTEAEIAARQKLLRKRSVFKKFFIFSIFFFLIAVGYAAYIYYKGGNTVSNDNIDISVQANTFTTGGEDFPMVIGIANRNTSPLQTVDLTVEYPKGASTDLSQDTERFTDSLGDIAPGALKNESLKVVLFGEQGSTREIKISIEYRVAGSNAIFVKDKLYDVAINSSPITMSVDAPTEISPNQDISFTVKETLNATKPLANMLMKVDYPFGFQFESADPKPTYDNDVWSLGDLAPGDDHTITITGKMVDVFDGEQKTFNVSTGSASDADQSIIGVVFNSLQQTVNVQKPFIEAQLYINGVYQNEYASDTQTPITGEIRWVNNLDTKVDNVQITAKITGNALDRRSIDPENAFYDSVNNSITWDKTFDNKFAEVDPGASGSVTFTFSPLASVDTVADPAINIDVSITGQQPLEGDATKEIDSSDSQIIRITSNLGLAAKALYYSGAFSNTGPIPPVAEQPTTYTIDWSLSNSTNDISNAKVTSSLPPWVQFVGSISPNGADLTYDPSTKQILWNVGTVPKSLGTAAPGPEVSFQVSLTPSLSQIGSSPVLINDAVLTGHDDFANVDVRVNKSSLDTTLLNDPQFPLTGSRVVDPGTQ